MPHEGHSHNHGHCHHEADDVSHTVEMGIEYSLYQKIDMPNLECLNEETDGSGKNVFKAYENRKDTTQFVRSDSGSDLLFNIPFTGNVKLKGILIIGANNDSDPSAVKLFKNRPKMTFDDVHIKPDQQFELTRDSKAEVEYPTKIVTFGSIHHLTMYFPSNFGEDQTQIYYIGLRGEFQEAHYHGVTICTYEARPNVADHKNETFNSETNLIS